jgi:hypothetical protein
VLARVPPEGRRRLLELGDRAAEWKRLGRREGHGLVRPDGEPFLRAKVASGIARTTGEVEVAREVPAEDALVVALLASYLLIRKTEEEAASTAGATAAVTGS